MKLTPGFSLLFIAVAMTLLPLTAQSAESPSFDCKKKLNKVEGLICSDPTLAQLDKTLADTYPQALSAADRASRTKIQASQKQWLQARSGICIAPQSWQGLFKQPISENPQRCLQDLYSLRIDELKHGKVDDFPVYWQAQSKTAYSITGDILFADASILLAGAKPLHVSLVKQLDQTRAMGDDGFDSADKLSLYKVEGAKATQLISGNYLCDEKTKPSFIVTAVSQDAKQLSIAVFSGAEAPVWKKSYLENTLTLCGTYGYSR
ncbi:lysozyme inhibitor LprI family protein [Serratia sp. AKBS12]|uniref:lysozyme inhibitor LprI family protein n=1 Tax=Serratia sp. AKBS12 TaxID=2974597 RepID=UPI002166A75E|nr:lysozyme inhibitor LprI family protein [Serratia sp. AKBS12]MCS3407135.1 lysozyme inhibitor LprI family protein [Serratia sp. AKBS12]